MAVSESRRSGQADFGNDNSSGGKYLKPSVSGEQVSDEKRAGDGGYLLFGITSWHIRLLCEPEFQGGAGKSLSEVAKLTPDQVYFLLCDREFIKGQRIKKMPAANVSAFADEDGLIKGRLTDGSVVRGRLRGPHGESYAAMIRKQVDEQNKRKQQRKRRKRHHGD